MPNNAFQNHDHSKCVASGLGAADRICTQNGLRLTPVRRRVLEILLEQHKAMGAYDVLDRLRGEGLADKPPVAYRALNFLVEHGLAHRIEKLNAFVACDHPVADHVPAFLICSTCQTVAESQDIATGALDQDLGKSGFSVDRIVIEAEGTCAHCQEEQAL